MKKRVKVNTLDFSEVKSLPGTHFVPPYQTRVYHQRQEKVLCFLKKGGYQELHLPFFVPQRLFSQLQNPSTNYLIKVFSGKDRRKIYFLRPFAGFINGVPFVAKNLLSHRQLPMKLVERGPLYGKFPAKWNLLEGSVEDYFGLHGVLVSDSSAISSLEEDLRRLFKHYRLKVTRRTEIIWNHLEAISFWQGEIFCGACFDWKNKLAQKLGVSFLSQKQVRQWAFWQSFYLSENLIRLLR